TGGADPSGDATAAQVDLTGIKGNVSVTAVSFLVSFRGAPLTGALIPARLPPTQQVPGGGGGGGGPSVSPPAPGSDFLFLMFDADNDTATGFQSGGHGYDYAIRVDGKGGRPLPNGASLLRWETAPSPAWTALTAPPAVAFGSSAVELGVALPPVVITARNVVVTAYATAWDGSHDDLDQPFTFGNEFGTRGSLPPNTVTLPIGEPTLWPPSAQIPEFQEVIVPVVGAAFVFFASRRGQRRSSKQQAN
ncbi:MAG: hypothetical protein ACREKH_10590, partial [Candidatus Rokuibacteriota bacterium]